MIQSKEELEQWYGRPDPWEYEVNPDDLTRRSMLLSELPKRRYLRALDIGCGEGFVTRHLPAEKIIGVDLSEQAIARANQHSSDRLSFQQGSLFELAGRFSEPFDLIVIAGVLYPQYIGNSNRLVYMMIDSLLAQGGVLASVHIDEWYTARFPYLLSRTVMYGYRDYTHRLEIYLK